MYARIPAPPDHSFFLFGPRGTGKATWLRHHFEDALWFNLLLEDDYLPLLASARSFRERVEARPHGSWIVVDEVQRAQAAAARCEPARGPGHRPLHVPVRRQ